jgi:hypothetical protein
MSLWSKVSKPLVIASLLFIITGCMPATTQAEGLNTMDVAHEGRGNNTMVCAERDAILAQLAKRYQEAPMGLGVSNGVLVELVVNEDTGSFTLLLVQPSGKACLLASGDGWRFLPPELVGPKA